MLSDAADQSKSAKSLPAGRRVGPRWIGGDSIELRTLYIHPAAEDVTRAFHVQQSHPGDEHLNRKEERIQVVIDFDSCFVVEHGRR